MRGNPRKLSPVIPGRGHRDQRFALSGHRLRPANPESITTAWGCGFRLSPPTRLGRNDELRAGNGQERYMTSSPRVGLLAALIAVALSPAVAQPQNYPNRTITVVVPFAPGGLTDVPVRILGAMMQERIGQNIVIENKPGGSGVVGGTFAVRAPPDGYTLFANSAADTQNLHYLPVPFNAISDLAMMRMITGWSPPV